MVMVLDLMHVHNFYCQIVNGVKNDVIFGVDNSSSVHDDNRKKDILVFCEGPTDWFDDAAITAEAK